MDNYLSRVNVVMLSLRLGVLWVCLAATLMAGEPLRVWVDADGAHAVEARLVDITEDRNVVLLRKDGRSVKVSLDSLSNKDQRYILRRQRQGFTEPAKPVLNRVNNRPVPQPPLDLPPATRTAQEDAPLQRLDAVPLVSNVAAVQPLPPDPSLWVVGAIPARIPIEPIDLYSRCSRPLGVVVEDDEGQSRTLIAVSISHDGTFRDDSGLAGDVATPSWEQANRLLKFDIDRRRGQVVLRTPEAILLLDHHLDSGRSLVHVGFDSLGHGGHLAIASGWQHRELTLDHRRQIGESAQITPPHLTWAAWIDEEHVLAKVDDTLYLWNLVSGEQLYAFDGLDERATPAISGGRRYVAVPGRGVVDVMTTFDGKSFGRISIDASEPPSVSFSTAGDRLAIASRRGLTVYDLTTASPQNAIESRRSLGDEPPIWIDKNLILSSSGVLVSRRLGFPVWRYDLTASEPAAFGNHVVALRRHPHAELTITSIPHDVAIDAMRWTRPKSATDSSVKSLLGRSVWGADGWIDEDVQMTSGPSRVR